MMMIIWGLIIVLSPLVSSAQTKKAAISPPVSSEPAATSIGVPSPIAKTSYPNFIQVYAMAGIWKEQSLLLKGDGSKYKINTLNTVTRIGGVYTFSNGHFFTRYGFIMGQSENSSAVDNFAYFQRSASLTGVEVGLGANFLRTPNIAFGLSLGGMYRIIKHTIPSDEYQFSTGSRALPNLSFDLAWRFSNHWSWRQSIGSQGQSLDTFWSAGFGYIL